MPLHVLGRGRPSGETPSRACHGFHEEFTSNSAFNYSTKKKIEMQKCRPYRINIKPSQKTSWLDFWHTINFSIYVVFFYTPQYNIASWLMAATPQLSCRGLSKKIIIKNGRTYSVSEGWSSLALFWQVYCAKGLRITNAKKSYLCLVSAARYNITAGSVLVREPVIGHSPQIHSFAAAEQKRRSSTNL